MMKMERDERQSEPMPTATQRNPTITKEKLSDFHFKPKGRGKLGVLKAYHTTIKRHDEYLEDSTSGGTKTEDSADATAPQRGAQKKNMVATPARIAQFIAVSGLAFNFFESHISEMLTPMFA